MKRNRVFPINKYLVIWSLVIPVFMCASNASGEAIKPDLPKGKQTSLGLYVTAAEAYDNRPAAHDAVKVFDVRTLEEYI